MHIVIESADWQRLSSGTRDELLRLLRLEPAAAPAPSGGRKGFRWRVPYDLTPALARKLLRGLSEESLKRLRLFAERGGRVTMQELLAVTQEKDLHALSTFEGTVTRKLRRLVGDENKIVSLMMWDYDSEKWDADHKKLVDGVYYVSPGTVRALQQCFART
jgi:hypothetical protein